ncbi:ead/Ea22-like family protein [Pseudomonas putida]|uniref:ead/Ea22-like family protein n=1 Tax=Pseudomonas putida TaxID=303 RepID=UPI0023648491|nr:ead/Ea22-like family protein [Pseudomonas putida]MDD2027077.1 ead/Ea22-like family protein [Pseudomonas putida]HDS1765662.1 ead/Ea22-like family protein [Pseudomonas putida]
MDTNKMTIDKAQLKSLAEDSLTGDWYEAGDLRYEDRKTGDIHGLHHDDDRFIAAAGPATVLALLAEIERLKAQVRLADVAGEMAVHEAVGRAATDYGVAILERDQLKAENEALRKALLEASEEVATWGEYASEYFQKKHDLAGCVAKIHAAAMAKEASHD